MRSTSVSVRRLRAKNLPWTVSAEEISRELAERLGANGWECEISVCPLLTERKRDAGKLHQGSARVTFIEESAAMEALATHIILDSGNAVHWEPWLEKVVRSAKNTSTTSSDVRLARAAKRQRRTARRLVMTADLAASLMQKSQSLGERYWELRSLPELDWKNIPSVLDPKIGGKLSGDRAFRKRGTVQALAVCMNELVGSSLERFADLGSGAGNAGLPLAYLTNSSLIAVDCNREALARLATRAQETSLHVSVLCADLAQPLELSTCQAVVAVHTCGALSDMAMEAAVSSNLPFFISPCCIGKTLTLRNGNNLNARLRAARTDDFEYPRSSWLRSQLAHDTENDLFSLLATAADYGGDQDDLDSFPDGRIMHQMSRRRLQRRCKRIVDTDRLLNAAERAQYSVALIDMGNQLLGPRYLKRELLIGVPSTSAALLTAFLRRFCLRRRAS